MRLTATRIELCVFLRFRVYQQAVGVVVMDGTYGFNAARCPSWLIFSALTALIDGFRGLGIVLKAGHDGNSHKRHCECSVSRPYPLRLGGEYHFLDY
jgi:hypothetical protein